MMNEQKPMQEIHNIRENIYYDIKDLDEPSKKQYFSSAIERAEKLIGKKLNRKDVYQNALKSKLEKIQ